MRLTVKSKADGDLILKIISDDLTIETQAVNDLIITTRDIVAEGDAFLLLEDGFFFLLEDGAKLILE